MNLVKAWIIAAVLVNISTATTTIIYILPDNSSNISCPSHQCATFSQYFLDNDTLPVVSNVEYHLLPGEHYIISTEVILLGYLLAWLLYIIFVVMMYMIRLCHACDTLSSQVNCLAIATTTE